MSYKIKGWCPDRNMVGGSGFTIVLTPEWKTKVAKSELTEDKVNSLIKQMGGRYLEAHGFGKDRIYDIRISWGEWGIEHITVPGNACGLDLDEQGSIGCRDGEVSLCPHNIDTIWQASLILSIFTWIADIIDYEIY